MPDTETQVQDLPEQEKDFVWHTRLGEQIPFNAMGDKHLVNTHAFIGKRLEALQGAHEQQSMDQNILGDNPEGFTGFEKRISYMETAQKLSRKEIDRRGLSPKAKAV
jgi:hypothetical protein|tara:strand:- start:1503 stop:1823 length:321 start_codon:yes stop_codon:yes gene_type:complete